MDVFVGGEAGQCQEVKRNKTKQCIFIYIQPLQRPLPKTIIYHPLEARTDANLQKKNNLKKYY